ncbi:chloride channel protein [Microvirga sp. GCM10011540]|uniref:chloride channel protein n=1 Tax=Microvirga sp. GCM10011540 TaxID=3317338 RepID=UPI003608C748
MIRRPAIQRVARQLLSLPADLVRPNLSVFLAEGHVRAWAVALVAGLLAACASVAFRLALNAVQFLWLGTMSERVVSAAKGVAWPIILAAPALGGLAVGLILLFVPGRRAGGPADVIEAQALGPDRLRLRGGLLGAVAAVLTLGSGGSAGREGPVIHLGATLAAALARWARLPEREGRALIGAGVAAAIAASFNAPIAGALFALEVVFRRISAAALPSIVIASAVGAIIGRSVFGDFPAFAIPEHRIASSWEFPAFAVLGVVAAAVAIVFQLAVMGAEWAFRTITIPLWLKPALGGLFVGALGVFFPEVLGVGYETAEAALIQSLPLGLLISLLLLKTVATALTLGSRLAGGVFSPSLYLGAMAGAAFGIMAASLAPELASSQAVYTILGMGAVAGAVLGAPISTTVIVFELTGGYAMSIALLLTVAIASTLSRAFLGRSFFFLQLASRGLFLDVGPHRRVGRELTIKSLIRPLGPDESFSEAEDCRLTTDDSIEAALRAFDACGLESLPVADALDADRVVGVLDQAEALKAFNTALIDAVAEEHR